MFKVGDRIKYGFYSNIVIIDEDEHHFILRDKNGNTKKVFKTLVRANSSFIESELSSDEGLGSVSIGDCIDYGVYSGIEVVDEDEYHYILRDKNGNIKKVYKTLIRKYAKVLERM